MVQTRSGKEVRRASQTSAELQTPKSTRKRKQTKDTLSDDAGEQSNQNHTTTETPKSAKGTSPSPKSLKKETPKATKSDENIPSNAKSESAAKSIKSQTPKTPENRQNVDNHFLKSPAAKSPRDDSLFIVRSAGKSGSGKKPMKSQESELEFVEARDWAGAMDLNQKNANDEEDDEDDDDEDDDQEEAEEHQADDQESDADDDEEEDSDNAQREVEDLQKEILEEEFENEDGEEEGEEHYEQENDEDHENQADQENSYQPEPESDQRSQFNFVLPVKELKIFLVDTVQKRYLEMIKNRSGSQKATEFSLSSGLENESLYLQEGDNGIMRFNEEELSKDSDTRSQYSGISRLLKKSVLTKDFSKKDQIPSLRLRASEKEKKPPTAGSKWFDLPAPTITPQLKQDLQLLNMRAYLDPKRHYKKTHKSEIPKYFQIGTVVEGAGEFYSGRLTKKERKETIVDELLSDTKTKAFLKRKFQEVSESHKGKPAKKAKRPSKAEVKEKEFKKKKENLKKSKKRLFQ